LLRTQRSDRTTAAFRRGAGREGRRRCRSGFRRRGLPPRAGVRHAADGRARYRHGQGGDAARRRRLDQGSDPLSHLETGGLVMARMAWGAGLATLAADGTVLDTWYRWLGWGEFGDDDCPTDEIDAALGMRDTTDD